jgi:hypothetical protein
MLKNDGNFEGEGPGTPESALVLATTPRSSSPIETSPKVA